MNENIETESKDVPTKKDTVLDYDEGFVPDYKNKKGNVPDVTQTENPIEADLTTEKQSANKIRVVLTTDSLMAIVKALRPIEVKPLFVFTNKGLKIEVWTPNRISTIAMEMEKTDFIEYQINQEIGVEMDLDMFPDLEKGNNVQLTKNDENNLIIESQGMTYSMLIEEGPHTLQIPEKFNENFGYKMGIYSKKLKTFIKSAAGIGDAFSVKLLEDHSLNLVINSNGLKIHTEYLPDEIESNIPTIGNDAHGSYSPKELIKFFRIIPVNDMIEVEFKSDYPIKISFKLPQPKKSNEHAYRPVKGYYLLAPMTVEE